MKNLLLKISGEKAAKTLDDKIRSVLKRKKPVLIKGKDTYAKAKFSSDTLSVKDIRRAVKALEINSEQAKFISIHGVYRHRWWMKIICWFKGHQKTWAYSYGVKFRQCKRCGKEFHRFGRHPLSRFNKSFYSGEIGQLYAVRFITTKVKRKKSS